MKGYYERGPVTVGLLVCLMCLLSPALLQAQPLFQVLQNHQETGEFARIVKNAGLDARLNTNGPYTIFAPSNNAMQRAAGRLNLNNTGALRSFLLNHILTGKATKRHISAMSRAPTLGGLTIRFQNVGQGHVVVNNVAVISYNIHAQNGIIHVIDAVLE